MALVFPRDMPVGGVESQEFDIGRVDYVSPANRGRVGSVQAGFPLWGMVVNLASTTEDEADDWSAFKDSLRGAARLFFGCDLSRPFPKAYQKGFAGLARYVGGGAFDGSATSWSLNSTRDVVTINGLPENFAANKRDYIGFKWSGGDKRALVRCVEAITGSAVGVLAITVEPPVPGGADVAVVPGDATLHFDNPKCLMRLVTQQTKLGARDVLHSQGGTVTAIQDLIP